LPWQQLEGNVTIYAKVWVRGHENDVGTGWHGQLAYAGLYFWPPRPAGVVRILVIDNILKPPPAMNPPGLVAYNRSLRGARIRMPVSEDGFEIHIAPGYQTINSNVDLSTDDGWKILLQRIEDIAEDFEDKGQIWTALVPDDRRYANLGIAYQYTWYSHPHMVARAERPATFAHEMGHTLRVNHAPSPPPGQPCPGGEDPGTPDQIDPRLPGYTEDIGLDVTTLQLIPAGRGEVMGYCDGETSWPSIALWNLVFDEFSLTLW
jgi:hypothetical protein